MVSYTVYKIVSKRVVYVTSKCAEKPEKSDFILDKQY